MRSYKIGEKLLFRCEEPDGTIQMDCTVKHVFHDHAIAVNGTMTLWIDDDTEELFQKKQKTDSSQKTNHPPA